MNPIRHLFKRIHVRLLPLLLFCSVLLCQPAAAAAGQSDGGEALERFNVMLVIDGSGSLVGDNGTDPGGLRYDAIDLFLALLTNSGNNVGAIVFDHQTEFDEGGSYLLNTGLLPISGRDDKLSLADQIRQSGTRRGDTDIGSALLTAVNVLAAQSAQNGLKSVVILFSDGMTDLVMADDRSLPDTEAMETSDQRKAEAEQTAQDNHIPVYSICLNIDGRAAQPRPGRPSGVEELRAISDHTSGHFVEVSDTSDLADAFEMFYGLIFATSGGERIDSTLAPDGTLVFDIDVPSYGAEEVNIILDTDDDVQVQLTSPTAPLSPEALANATMSGGDYDVIKLDDPEVGRWVLHLAGAPDDSVTINIIYNIDSTVTLSLPGGKTDYAVGETASFTAQLYRDGNPVSDASVTNEYTAWLTLTDLSGAAQSEPVQMTPAAGGVFTYDFQTDEPGSYEAQVELRYANLFLVSNTQQISFGNTPPVASPTLLESSAVVTPVSGRNRSFDLSSYFSDPQGDPLTYSIVSSQLVDGTVDLDGGALTVDTSKSRSGDLVVRATDSYGAYADMTIHFKVTNLTPALFGLILAGVGVGAAVAGSVIWARTHRLFRGSLSVSNLEFSTSSGMARSHASFRGKVKLSYFALGACGFDANKCCFVALPQNRIEFRSPKKQPFYINGVAKNRMILLPGTNTIHANENRTMGIRVIIK